MTASSLKALASNNMRKARTILLALAYFLLAGFGVPFVSNLFLRESVWIFFKPSLFISIINLFFSLFFLYLGVIFLVPLVRPYLDKAEKNLFIASAILPMFLALMYASVRLWSELDNSARILQTVTALLLLGIFSFLSYNKVIKE
jgi:hypothetical protein